MREKSNNINLFITGYAGWELTFICSKVSPTSDDSKKYFSHTNRQDTATTTTTTPTILAVLDHVL